MKDEHKIDLVVPNQGPFTIQTGCSELCRDVTACKAFAFSKRSGLCELYEIDSQDGMATFQGDEGNEHFSLWDRM